MRESIRRLQGRTLWLLGHAAQVWPIVAVGVVLWLTWSALSAVHIRDVRSALSSLDPRGIWLAGAFTALNVSVMGLYDVIAFRDTRSPVWQRWRYGAVAFAWSNFLTLGPLAGPAIRFWLYAPAIDRAADLQGGVVAIAVAFTSGLAGWIVSVLLAPSLNLGFTATAALALALTGLIVVVTRGVLAMAAHMPGHEITPARSAEMALVGWLDWLLASLAFVALLRATAGGGAALVPALRAFFVGQGIGLVSLVPGGFGSADAYWVTHLPIAAASAAAVVASFRVVYYVAPWALASLLLLSWATRRAQRRIEIARTVVAGLTGAGGLLIMLSSASPSLHARLVTLERIAPLPLVELGQLTAAMTGLLLLALARGLARGYRAAFRWTMVLLTLGATASLLKGFDWEEAVVLGALAVAAASQAALFDRDSQGDWIEGADVALATVAVAAFVVVGVLTHRTGFGAFSRWMELGYRLEASRFARSAIALTMAVTAGAIYVALRVPIRFARPSPGDVRAALDLHARIGGSSTPLMVANGDKAIFQDGERGLCLYRINGPYLIVFADPVVRAGDRAVFLDALFRFAGELDRRPLFYQVSPDWIPPLHDRGYIFFKLGEEAMVRLASVTTDGHQGKMYRQILKRAERDGVRFRVLAPYEVERRLDELQQISDDWLETKAVGERQFSIGFFDRDYIAMYACAIVEEIATGRIIAFANLLEGPRRVELSVDLMRYRSDAPKVMDYLCVSLFLYAKTRGYERFNLGMAPLASVGVTPGAHGRERLARVLFQHGEHWYNFQGLRYYKQKFEPEWQPRYMGYQSAWEFAVATAYVSALIAGGWGRVLTPSETRRVRSGSGSTPAPPAIAGERAEAGP